MPHDLRIPGHGHSARMTTGTLTTDDLQRLVDEGIVSSAAGIQPAQVQPASIDLSLSAEAYRMPGSMLALPGETVRSLIDALALERLSLDERCALARGQVYLVRLREALALPPNLEAYTNSKSSTGRLDLATRVLTDGTPRYDRISAGYHGEVWLELIPRSFDICARAGDSLNQAIFFRQRQVLDHAELLAYYRRDALLFAGGRPVPERDCLIDGRLVMTADLQAPIVGYVARRSHRPVDLGALASHRPPDYFDPIMQPPSGYLFLEKGRFYILATRERVAVPAELACEMVPYDPAAGEFRAHYAGFFDPGWGIVNGRNVGCRAVLEVRPHEDDLVLRHGQPICAMAYERLTAPVSCLYGQSGNNYADQDGPRLSKHFADQ